MKAVFTELITKLKTAVPALRYLNWDIGQLDGYYLKPSVTLPCALLSFPQIATEPIGNNALMADVILNIKLCTERLSHTSNLAPMAVQAKGLEIWELQKAITKALHGKDGISYNTIQQIAIQQEQREDGLQVLNIQLGFIVEDYTASPTTQIITPMDAFINDADNLLPIPPNTTHYVADFATFNSATFLDSLIKNGGQFFYDCTHFKSISQGIEQDNVYSATFTNVNLSDVPTQQYPYKTIPQYFNNSTFFIDTKWLDFLGEVKNLTSNLFTLIQPSPWSEVDAGFPNAQVGGVPTNKFDGRGIYGEGFQLVWPIGVDWSMHVDYWYSLDGLNFENKHTIVFSNNGMLIDGGFVPAGNKTAIKL
jgi:hypothetical protein